ncbi:MAG: methyltransferase domain-containing protein [Patescibacteria group bacterium]|nr:methyltransferase domain-containing protein [Patescibacteria group bacterium]
MATVFILGRLPELSRAEINAVLGDPPATLLSPDVLRLNRAAAESAQLLARLGGTVKIGVIMAPEFSPAAVAEDILREADAAGKLNFGLSWYGKPKAAARRLAAGLEVKKILKAGGRSCRLVTSQDAQLSAVVVRKNHCREYLVLPDQSLARTLAVQDFVDFTRRDVGRPHRDLKSGTLPPKLARIMVNLARLPAGGSLLDPFCGSGTILTEAVLAGVGTVAGTDISERAVTQSLGNLQWISRQYPTAAAHWQVQVADARKISTALGAQRFDAVVTEPYLGPPRRGRESKTQLENTLRELAALYREAFHEFHAVLKPGGRVVFAQPAFATGRQLMTLPIADDIRRLGFAQQLGPLDYARPEQYVVRQLTVWQRA